MLPPLPVGQTINNGIILNTSTKIPNNFAHLLLTFKILTYRSYLDFCAPYQPKAEKDTIKQQVQERKTIILYQESPFVSSNNVD